MNNNINIKLSKFGVVDFYEHLASMERQLEDVAKWARQIYLELMDEEDMPEHESILAKLDAIEYTSDNIATILDCVFGLRIRYGALIDLANIKHEAEQEGKKKRKKTPSNSIERIS